MNELELQERIKHFVVRTIRMCQNIPSGDVGKVIRLQLIRCVTAVGANYRAACKARSLADFLSKINIVEEEIDETQYWLDLLVECGVFKQDRLSWLIGESKELTAIIAASGRTARKNLQNAKTAKSKGKSSVQIE